MKRIVSLLFAACLPLLPSVATAQPAPHEIIINGQWKLVPIDPAPTKAPCGCKTATAGISQDDADFAQAIMAGFGNRIAIGPYRQVTLAVRQYQADKAVGRTDAADRFRTAIAGITPNPQRKCTLATIGVLVAEFIPMFDPSMTPAQAAAILKAAQELQALACGTPPPTKAPHKAATTNWVSPQFILDGCAGSNGGCNGDDNTTVLGNAKNMGIPLEADYGPYQASSQGCHTMAGNVMLYTLSDWGYADPNSTGVGNTALIKAAIMKYNGVGCAVAADNAFENYSGGVFNGNNTGINHDVFLAGWDDSKGAWLLVNSWGDWGIDPTTGKAVKNPVAGKPTGLKLLPLNVRLAKHALYRQRNMRAIADLAKAAETLPATYSCIATQPPIQDQGQCGTCWDFSGCRVVSGANILAGTLPKTAPMTSGCMWIKYGANQIGTEPVYGIGGKPVPYVAPPGPGPQPRPSDRVMKLYGEGLKNPALGEKMLHAAEDVYQNAP